MRAHPKSVDLDVVSQGRHLRANYIFEHAHERETSPYVGHGCYVRVKILQGAFAVEEIVWFGSRHAGVSVESAASRVFGQANAGVEWGEYSDFLFHNADNRVEADGLACN